MEYVNGRGEISPGHVTDVAGDLHSAGQTGLFAGHGSLQYQGTDYTILDEAPSEQTLSLSQRDSILYLVPFPETLQLALSRRFGEFASLMFDPSGLPQIVFRSVGLIQAARQSARLPPHSVTAGTSQTAARSLAGAPSTVRSSPMDLSVGAPPPQAPWSSGLGGGPLSCRPGPHHHPPPPLIRLRSQGGLVSRQGLQTPGGVTIPRCLSPCGPIRWSIRIDWTWPTTSSGW